MIDYLSALDQLARWQDQRIALVHAMGRFDLIRWWRLRYCIALQSQQGVKMIRECRAAALDAAQQLAQARLALTEIEKNEREGADVAEQDSAAKRCGLSSLDRRKA